MAILKSVRWACPSWSKMMFSGFTSLRVGSELLISSKSSLSLSVLWSLPMQDTLRFEIVECGGELAEDEPEWVLTEAHVLLQMVPQVSPEKQIHHHKQVLFVYPNVTKVMRMNSWWCISNNIPRSFPGNVMTSTAEIEICVATYIDLSLAFASSTMFWLKNWGYITTKK